MYSRCVFESDQPGLGEYLLVSLPSTNLSSYTAIYHLSITSSAAPAPLADAACLHTASTCHSFPIYLPTLSLFFYTFS